MIVKGSEFPQIEIILRYIHIIHDKVSRDIPPRSVSPRIILILRDILRGRIDSITILTAPFSILRVVISVLKLKVFIAI